MAQLPLDDVQRDAFAGHLDGVCVSELVRREPTANPGRYGKLPQRRPCRGWRPRSALGGSIDNAQQRADTHRDADLDPGVEVLPRGVGE